MKPRADMAVCWFCGRRPGDPAASRTRELYSDARDRLPTKGQPFSLDDGIVVLKVTVPRCTKCRSFHARQRVQSVLLPLLGFAAGIAIVAATPAGGMLAGWGGADEKLGAAAIILGVPLVLLLVARLVGRLVRRKSNSAGNVYPPFIELEQAGWLPFVPDIN